MTLATSCPTCGTVFKVIEDQLKVSEGWVRCGHCHSVFNALEGLFDLGARPRSSHSRPMTEGLASGTGVLQDTPPMALTDDRMQPDAAPARQIRSAVATSGLAAPSSFGDVDASELPTEFAPPPTAEAARAPSPSAELDLAAPQDSVHERHELQAPHRPGGRQLDFSDADTVFLAHDPPGSQDPLAAAGSPGREPFADVDPAPAVPSEVDSGLDGLDAGFDASSRTGVEGHDPWTAPMSDEAGGGAPSFVRHADRAAWWSRPVVRGALLVGCLIAAAGVLLQVGLMRRDLLAAQSPLAATLLMPSCELLGCTIEPPRLLDALAVESSNMVKLSGVDGYRLQVMLRNRAEHVVRAPSVELSLTDATGALVVRRVLQPADFRQAESLAAQAEGNWQLEFASSDRRVAGYTVAIFYP